MAKITSFKNLTTPANNAVLPIVDDGVTQKISIENLRTSMQAPATTTSPGVIVVGQNLTIENGILSAPDPTLQANWTATSGPSVILNKPTLSAVATSGSYSDLSNKPSIPQPQVQVDWNETDNFQRAFIKNKPTKLTDFQNDAGFTTFDGVYNSLTNKPTIPTDLGQLTNNAGYSKFSGNYNDLTNKPTIPAAQVQSDWNAVSGISQILNKPTIPTVTTQWVAVPPTSSVGNTGDIPGMIAANSLYVFVCYGTYDGVSNIWARSATGGGTWTQS